MLAIDKFVKTYFHNYEKYSQKELYRSTFCHIDIYFMMCDTAPFNSEFVKYLKKYVNGDIQNDKFDILKFINIDLGSEELITYLENIANYYVDPLYPLPCNFNPESKFHRSYLYVKCMNVFSQLYEVCQKNNENTITPEFIAAFSYGYPSMQLDSLFQTANECERLYKMYGEFSDFSLMSLKISDLKKICARMGIRVISSNRKPDILNKIRNNRGF